MRVTSVLRRLLGIAELFVEEVRFLVSGDLSVVVRPRWRFPRCGQCGQRAPGYDRKPLRSWLHLPFGRTQVVLRYAPRRVACQDCGIRVEQVPWAEHGSRFSRPFEELVAYLAQISDQTKVTQLVGIAWSTVGSIVERVVSQRLDPSRFEGLRRIGIDEFSYRKRHHYITTVVDHDRRRVIWAGEGRSADALAPFFDALGARRCRKIRLVTIDMAGGYIKAVRERLPQATIVFDRFHVERLVLFLPMSDWGDSHLDQLLEKAVPFIDDARASAGRVLVFCGLGVNRSPALVSGYLVMKGWKLDEAIEAISSDRPGVSIHEGYLSQLRRLES